MKKYWGSIAKSLTPYQSGEQPKEKMIKLNTNENAYPPSPKVKEAVDNLSVNLRLYPNADSDDLRKEIAKYHHVLPEQVFCADGSDEVLAYCYAAFYYGMNEASDSHGFSAEVENCIKFPDVTYSFYPVWAQFFSVPVKIVPLLDDFTVDVPNMCGAKGVVLANPNAPTAIELPISSIEKILRKTHGIVIVDEAYANFGAKSAIPLLMLHKNLCVVRTLSKTHSLAGLRVGYAIADRNLISALETVKNSFNSYPLSTLQQLGAIAALRDKKYYEDVSFGIAETRAYFVEELWKMGINCLPSKANFVFAEFVNPTGAQVQAALKERGILVRRFDQERIKNYLRITIGTQEEMTVVVQTLREIL